MGDTAAFDEPINSARVALEVLGNLFQSQNLIEWISGWWSPIVALFHDLGPHCARILHRYARITAW